MKSSTEELMSKMEMLYENIYNLLGGFQKASTAANSNINVNLKKEDGSIESVTINSFQKLQQELNRIDNNYKSLINADNLSYTVESDGSISQQSKTSFINAEYLENFNFNGDECIVDKTSVVDDLVFPAVKIPITINSKLRSDIRCKIFEISDGWENIPENPSIIDLEYLYNNGRIQYREVNRTLNLEKQQVNYFGKFTIESLNTVSNNTFELILNTIKYTGLNTIGDSIDLNIGDIVVSKTGSSKYIIDYLDKFTNKIIVTRISGSEILGVGIDGLFFNEIMENGENVIGIPVKPTQKLIVFLSTENIKNISFPSKGIKLDTETYKVIYQNSTYTLNEFFSNFVTNFSEYLLSFINETSIPISLGIKPSKPVLENSNFKVIQINKHITDSKSSNEINELNKRKQSITNEIEYKQTQIDRLQEEIDTQKFKSVEEKNNKLNKIISSRQQINTLKQNVLTVARDIDSNAIEYGLKTTKPKYRIIGFWPMNETIYSPLTSPQHIIKYEVQYRYLSKDLDTIENTSYTMISNGKEVTVAFSPWNTLQTKTLNKIKNINGDLEWERPIVDSIEDININQLTIPINEGESIEVRVKGISEAGYPIAPIKSDWSDIIRVDFPNELKESNISSTISKNNTDLNKAEFENILSQVGLLNHVAGTIKESEKTFYHSAKDIASGQYTTEQKNIPLDNIISDIIKDLDAIKNSKLSNNISLNLIDFNNEAFTVKNNTTMELFAGNYSDSVNLLDTTKWGSIIRKKGYIKIRNNNNVPIEIKSLVPGTQFDSLNASQYYNVPIKTEDSFLQASKQIIYFRNLDLTGQEEDIFRLVKSKLAPVSTIPRTQDMDGTAIDSERNVVYFDSVSGTTKICKLQPEYATNFVAFTTEHPLYNYDDMSQITPEFDRIKLYTENLKALQYQSEMDANDELGLGFNDNDFYSIGETSCGAFLYPLIVNKESIKVVGNTTIATLIIPKESELLIPFVFEFRMIDRFGNINGQLGFDVNNSLEYSKKIGIDMLVNNESFKFDINITSKLKSKVSTIDSLNVNSVIGALTDDGQQTLS